MPALLRTLTLAEIAIFMATSRRGRCDAVGDEGGVARVDVLTREMGEERSVGRPRCPAMGIIAVKGDVGGSGGGGGRRGELGEDEDEAVALCRHPKQREQEQDADVSHT